MPLSVDITVILRCTWISLAGAATSIVFVITKPLLRQKLCLWRLPPMIPELLFAIQWQLSLELSLIFTAVLRCWEHSFWLWQSLKPCGALQPHACDNLWSAMLWLCRVHSMWLATWCSCPSDVIGHVMHLPVTWPDVYSRPVQNALAKWSSGI